MIGDSAHSKAYEAAQRHFEAGLFETKHNSNPGWDTQVDKVIDSAWDDPETTAIDLLNEIIEELHEECHAVYDAALIKAAMEYFMGSLGALCEDDEGDEEAADG